MTRKLKVLGLALIAVLAMSSVAASAASAQNFTASAYPATVTGSQSTTHQFVIGGNRTLTCDVATFALTLTASSPTATVTPKYGSTETACHVILLENTFDATVDMKGCDFLFTEPVGLAGKVHVKCPAGSGPITITVYNGHKVTHNVANEICRYTIVEQSPGGGLTYTNNTPVAGQITAHANVTGVNVVRAFGTLAACGAAAQTAVYTGSTVLKAVDKEGKTISGDVG